MDTRSTRLRVRSDAAEGSPRDAILSGTGTPAIETSAPGGFDFGNVEVGKQSSWRLFTVTNRTAQAVNITAAEIVGSQGSQFPKQSDGCTNRTLAAGGSTVEIAFRRESQGQKSAQLRVTPGSGLPVSATLTGSGTAAAGGGGGGDATTIIVSDTSAPTILNLTFGSGTLGATLSERAQLEMKVERRLKGRKVKIRGKLKCVKPKRKHRKRKRCFRYRNVKGSPFRVQGNPGRNTLKLVRVLRGARLKPGVYRATIVAIDAAGNRSAPVRKSFRVFAKRKKKAKRKG